MTRKASVPAYIVGIVTFFLIAFIFTLLIALTAVAQTQSTIVLRGPAVYDSGGKLASTVAVADVNSDGNPDVVVANAGNYPGTGSVAVLLGKGNGTFQPAVVYSTDGWGPGGIAIGDLNNDGYPDLVVANTILCATSEITCVGVLLGNGDGTFQPVVTYSAGGHAPFGSRIPLMIVDVNCDGKPDLVLISQTDSNLGDGRIAVLLGIGDGTFEPAAIYDSGGFGAFSGVSADVNGDGKPDLVVLNCNASTFTDCQTGEGKVGVLLGNGDGTFQPVKTYGSGGIGGFRSPLVVADVNGDGKPDLLVGNSVSDCGSLGVLLGIGDGTFRPAVTYTAELPMCSVASISVGDLNRDGKLDVAVAGGVIGVFFGNGDGTFRPITTYPNNPSTTVGRQVFVVDMNRDANLDLVVIGDTPLDVTSADVFLGNGDGTFQAAQSYKLGGSEDVWATLADVNGDGRPDLVAANQCTTRCSVDESTVGILLNVSKSPTSTALTSTLNPSTYGQTVVFRGAVKTTGPVPPTGTVVFGGSGSFGTFAIGTAQLNGGVATLTKSNLNAGPYPLTAVYKGDVNNAPSTSSVLSQTVLQAKTAATITSSLNPSTVGQAVTFTAKITSPTVLPTGPVTFTGGTVVLGTVLLSGGKATFTTSSLPPGSNAVKVTYLGNSNIAKSSAAVTQVVQP